MKLRAGVNLMKIKYDFGDLKMQLPRHCCTRNLQQSPPASDCPLLRRRPGACSRPGAATGRVGAVDAASLFEGVGRGHLPWRGDRSNAVRRVPSLRGSSAPIPAFMSCRCRRSAAGGGPAPATTRRGVVRWTGSDFRSMTRARDGWWPGCLSRLYDGHAAAGTISGASSRQLHLDLRCPTILATGVMTKSHGSQAAARPQSDARRAGGAAVAGRGAGAYASPCQSTLRGLSRLGGRSVSLGIAGSSAAGGLKFLSLRGMRDSARRMCW